MIKSKELTDPQSCLNKAEADEMVFVLLARDKAAPEAIVSWVNERIRLGLNKLEDPQIVEAIQCRHAMLEYQTMVWLEQCAWSGWMRDLQTGEVSTIHGDVFPSLQALRCWLESLPRWPVGREIPRKREDQ